MVSEVSISIKGFSSIGESYRLKSSMPLSQQQVFDICKRYESDTSFITDCGNNVYLCDVRRCYEN